LAWGVAALLLLWALAWLAVPPILKSQAEQRLTALLGRDVQIGRIDFSPWSLQLTLEKFSIASSAGAATPPQLFIERAMVNADMRSLLRLAPVIETLQIDAPVLRMARIADGRFDFDDIVARLAKASTAAEKPSDEPARFALYNVQLQGGSVEFDDRPAQRLHRLQDLQIALPFLSNLPDDVAVEVQPRVAFKLNGAAFDSGAQSTPFAQARTSQIELTVAGLDLAPWLPYVPAGLPLRPSRGRLATQLQLHFSLAVDGSPHVTLRGKASLADAAFVTAGDSGKPALAWQRLEVALDDVQPLARKVALGAVSLAGAQIDVRRSADGGINLVPAPAAAASAPATASSTPATAASAAAKTVAATSAWQVGITSIAMTQARIDWHDASTQPAAALRAEAMDVQVGALRWPFESPAPLKLTAQLSALDAQGAAAAPAAELTVDGRASDRSADANAELKGLDLAWLQPYLAASLDARVEGRVSAKSTLAWTAGEPAQIKLSDVGVQVAALKLVDGNRSRAPLSAGTIALSDASIDLAARQATLGTLRIDRPSAWLTRDTKGQWNFERWMRTSTAAPARGDDGQPPWRVALGELQWSGGDFRIDDQRPAPPPAEAVQLRGALDGTIEGFSWPSGAPAKTTLRLRVSQTEGSSQGARSGRVYWTGTVALSPLAARGALRVERFPAHAFEPYFGSGLNVALLRGEIDWRGDIAVAQRADNQWNASAKGNARITDLRVHERIPTGASGNDELLTWQAFTLDGLAFDLSANAKPTLEIASAELTDFYSRLVITEDGRFNLRDVAAAPVTGGAPPAAAGAASAPTPAPAPAPMPSPAASAAAARTAADSDLPIDISIGGVRLAGGKVDFTDRFIKPNYSAALTELNGTLGAFNSTTRDMATLDLKGRAAGTALLSISGAINPTARPLAMDIKAKATDLELAPLSPYSGRYAGYAIERGKLSMDVAYKIDADGKLDAKNQVILNQLTFGDKVDSPDATKLPVLLAVALLKDRNGVIDLNLPISGSINDPQFSIFGLVLKVIGNLLVKAVTAPFALLAGGGGEDLSFVAFAPGTTTFTDAGRATLDKVGKALLDRPALRMTVTGSSDPQSERQAIQQAALNARIAAEQKRDALRDGAAADATLPALTTAQREAIVKRIYSDTKLPDKPRNAFGFARDIPVAEMEALLRGATPVTPDSARELALQRGVAVRDALIAKGLPSERMFLAAPKLRTTTETDAAWSPRAQLALATN
jgi:uncharacterized protein involved in outer membrane biogenesis